MKKNKWTAFALCLCLGYVGAHKFYLGKTGIGVLYLCLAFTGLSLILWAIDIVLLLCMSEEAFNLEYNTKHSVYAAQPQQIVINNISGGSSMNTNSAEEISKLFELKEKGAITEEEFQERKSKLV